MHDKEKALAEDKRKLDEQVADQVASQLKAERARVAAEEAKKAKAAAATEMEGKDPCEWGHDDYSLNVANLPMAQKKVDAPPQDDLFAGEGV